MSFFAHAVSSPGTPLSSFFPHLSCLPKAPVLGLVHVSLLSLPSSAHMPDAYIALFKLQSASETFPPQPSVWIFQGGVFYDLANTARLCVSLLGCRDKLPHTEWLQTIDTYPLTLLSAGV